MEAIVRDDELDALARITSGLRMRVGLDAHGGDVRGRRAVLHRGRRRQARAQARRAQDDVRMSMRVQTRIGAHARRPVIESDDHRDVPDRIAGVGVKTVDVESDVLTRPNGRLRRVNHQPERGRRERENGARAGSRRPHRDPVRRRQSVGRRGRGTSRARPPASVTSVPLKTTAVPHRSFWEDPGARTCGDRTTRAATLSAAAGAPPRVALTSKVRSRSARHGQCAESRNSTSELAST